MKTLLLAAAVVLTTVSVRGLNESSGIAASRRHPGVFWSHNDSGGGPWLYAFDREGNDRGRFRVRNARANDWEDIAAGPGKTLYIGDIGDNTRSRKYVTVYRIPEPNIDAALHESAPAEAFRFEYPDGPHDAECLMVHPVSGDVYIVTKARGSDSETIVFKAAAPLRSGKPVRLRRVATLDLSASLLVTFIGGITGGDISPDGTRVVLCDYMKAWEAALPEGTRGFDAIWKAKWREIALGSRAQGEAVCYRGDGKAILATSEGAAFPLIENVTAGN